VTGSTYIAAILIGRVSVFRLRTEQGNELPFDNINPEDKWRGRIPLGLSKAINCLLTISVQVAAGDLDKPNFVVLCVKDSLGHSH